MVELMQVENTEKEQKNIEERIKGIYEEQKAKMNSQVQDKQKDLDGTSKFAQRVQRKFDKYARKMTEKTGIDYDVKETEEERAERERDMTPQELD